MQLKLSVHGNDRQVLVPARFEDLSMLKRKLATKGLTADQVIELVLENLYLNFKDIPVALFENGRAKGSY